jgi:hypothetical protein
MARGPSDVVCVTVAEASTVDPEAHDPCRLEANQLVGESML